MIILFGIIGAVIAFVMLNIIAAVLGQVDTTGAIICGVVTISGIICACSAWIVKTIKTISLIDKDESVNKNV